MRKIKRGILAFLLGEFLVISKKDKNFKKQFVKKQGFEKITFLFQTLFHFNKELIEEGKNIVKDINIPQERENKLHTSKERIENEYKVIKGKIAELEENRKERDKKYIQNALHQLEERYTPWYQKALDISKDLDKKYALKDKLIEIKKHITKLKRRKL